MTGLVVAVLVGTAGAVGAAARWAVAQRLPGRRSTLLVNVVGSLLLGLVADLDGTAYAVVATGFCGAFTTFSAFALDSSEGEGRTAHAVATLALCVTAAAVGVVLADQV